MNSFFALYIEAGLVLFGLQNLKGLIASEKKLLHLRKMALESPETLWEEVCGKDGEIRFRGCQIWIHSAAEDLKARSEPKFLQNLCSRIDKPPRRGLRWWRISCKPPSIGFFIFFQGSKEPMLSLKVKS